MGIHLFVDLVWWIYDGVCFVWVVIMLYLANYSGKQVLDLAKPAKTRVLKSLRNLKYASG